MQYINPQQTNPQHSNYSDDTINFANAREFIKDKLFFVSLSRTPVPEENIHFFSIDQQFVYTNFYADFGPSNMSHVIRFCNFMQEKLDSPALANKILCLCTSFEIDRRANAGFLLCCFMILVYKKTPEEAYQSLMGINPPFIPYRDAGYGPATYHITILDCIRGIYKAMQLGLFDINSFDVEQYEFYEKVENGDYNWITNKFVALACPKDDPTPGTVERFQIKDTVTKSSSGKNLYSSYRKNKLISWMLENNIKTIIRLNNKTYEKKEFLDAGIEHIELYFPDGSTPPDMILKRFLDICESRAGPIAVHCKAGLGRTGSLIASYLMKHYRLTACEVISFMRIIRPGSVVGPQQNYLQAMQSKLWQMTPAVKLAPVISCWGGIPSSLQITRFGPPKYLPKNIHASNPPLPEKRIATAADIITKSNKQLLVENKSSYPGRRDYQAESTDYDNELTRERNNHISLDDIAIPIQPRKHIGQHPVPRPEMNNPGAGWKQGSSIIQGAHVDAPSSSNGPESKYPLRHVASGTNPNTKPRSVVAADTEGMDINADNALDSYRALKEVPRAMDDE